MDCLKRLAARGLILPLERWVSGIKKVSIRARTLIHYITTKIREIIQGVWYLHSEDVVHGDLRGVSYYTRWEGNLRTDRIICRLTFSLTAAYE